MTNYSIKTVLLVIIILVLVELGYRNLDFELFPVATEPERLRLEEALKNEFGLIPIMPKAIEVDHHFGSKKELMRIGSKYNTDCNYEEIFDYYDAQLSEQGWQLYDIDENVYTVEGRMGGKIIEYKKDDFTATIQYAGENVDYGWIYGFSMNWGMPSHFSGM